MTAPVVVTHLQLERPEALRPSRPIPGTEVRRVHDPVLNATLYREIGADWSWTDRLPWSAEEWAAWARRVHTDVLLADAEIAGYYELDPQADGDVEIAIFGLVAAFRGRGLGGLLLTEAARRGWALPATRRVWVHTCTLDDPHALANYRARGFVPFRVETLAT